MDDKLIAAYGAVLKDFLEDRFFEQSVRITVLKALAQRKWELENWAALEEVPD